MKSLLKISFLMLACLLLSSSVFAQDKSKRASPPTEAIAKVGEADVKVVYSAPSAKGRTIWGELVPYGKVWRAGANEATTFETSTDLSIDGNTLAAGKYSIFLLPNDGEWTFIFNSIADQWGAYQYDEKKDVLRVVAKPEMVDSKSELLTYEIENDKLWLIWDDQMGAISLK